MNTLRTESSTLEVYDEVNDYYRNRNMERRFLRAKGFESLKSNRVCHSHHVPGCRLSPIVKEKHL